MKDLSMGMIMIYGCQEAQIYRIGTSIFGAEIMEYFQINESVR